MSSRTATFVDITGMGCVSPLGLDVPETLLSLHASRDGIAPVRLFPVDRCHARTAGQVRQGLSARAAAIAPRARRWTRAAQMLLVAMDEALRVNPGFAPDAVVIGTTSGGMTLGEEFYRAIAKNAPAARETRRMHGYMPHRPAAQAMAVFGFDAPLRIVSTACASGTDAIGLGCRMIRAGTARRVLAGGYDALAALVFSGFDCLRASTDALCRPFDAARNGLALGEGAAVLCLEQKPMPGGLRISGYGSAADTHHLTQPHPSGSGPLEAMRRALAQAGAAPESVDYINAHGTGTPLNDASEARAILQLCPRAPVSSTKGMTGHALGAAGAIEAVFSALAIRDGFLPANINFTATEPDLPLDIVANTIRETKPRRVLSNSFGFGGANASLMIEETP